MQAASAAPAARVGAGALSRRFAYATQRAEAPRLLKERAERRIRRSDARDEQQRQRPRHRRREREDEEREREAERRAVAGAGRMQPLGQRGIVQPACQRAASRPDDGRGEQRNEDRHDERGEKIDHGEPDETWQTRCRDIMRRRVQIGAPARAFRRADPAIVMVACRTVFLIYSCYADDAFPRLARRARRCASHPARQAGHRVRHSVVTRMVIA